MVVVGDWSLWRTGAFYGLGPGGLNRNVNA